MFGGGQPDDDLVDNQDLAHFWSTVRAHHRKAAEAVVKKWAIAKGLTSTRQIKKSELDAAIKEINGASA